MREREVVSHAPFTQLVLLGGLVSLISHGLCACHVPSSLNQRSDSEDQVAFILFGCLLSCHAL